MSGFNNPERINEELEDVIRGRSTNSLTHRAHNPSGTVPAMRIQGRDHDPPADPYARQ